MVNKNELAAKVCRMNKGKKQVPIGQVKEIIKDTFKVLRLTEKASDVLKAIGL